MDDVRSLSAVLARVNLLRLTESPGPGARAAARDAAARDRMERLGFPRDPRLRAVALSARPLRTPAMEVVCDVLRWRRAHGDRGAVVVLRGRPGCGKTAAACWLAWRTRYALLVAATEVVATGYGPRATPVEREAWRRWREASLLVLDDLGMESGAPEVVRELLFDRWNGGRITLVTTNLSEEELGARRYLDGRLASRLERAQAEDGMRWYRELEGSDLRDPAARAALEHAR